MTTTAAATVTPAESTKTEQNPRPHGQGFSRFAGGCYTTSRRNIGNTRQRHHAAAPTCAGGEKSGDRTTAYPCSNQVVYRRRGWSSMGA